MLLTYWRVHLLFTIPIATVLSFVLRPLLSKRNIAAIAFHVVVATAYTFPWDSYIIHNHAWWYPEWAVTYTIRKVPIEEIFFFIIQSIFTAELFILLGLLDTPSQHLSYCGPDAPLHRKIARYGPLAVFPAVGYAAWHYMAIPETKGFYLGCILWWISPVLTFLWWLAGDHFLSRRKTALLTILLPTFYLSIVDIIALRAGTWHINEATSTEIFVWPDLPLEEFTFFLLTSTILTVGMLAFDRCLAVVDVYGDVLVNSKQAGEAIVPWFIKPPRVLRSSWNHKPSSSSVTSTTAITAGNDVTTNLKKFGNSMLLNVDYLSAPLRSRIPAFEVTQAVLAKHSRSFHTASYVFPSAVRRDLVILYAFCRVMDDFCDESATKEEARELIQMSKEFLDLVYPGTTHTSRSANPSASSSPSLEKADKKSLLPSRPSSPTTAASSEKVQPPSDFAISAFLHKRVPKDAQSSFFLLSTITSRVPRYPFDDLIEGYEWDLAGRHEQPIVSEGDLIEYSRLVASSVAEMCVWAMWANEGSCPSDPETRKHILQKAASMGIALQITNISRDIKEDAGKGRIYLPQEWFRSTPDEKKHFKVLEDAANAQASPSHTEFPYAVYIRRLLDLAEVHKVGTNEAIRQLPRSCQAGIRAATRVYIGIGAEISKLAFDSQGNPNLEFDGRRISLTKWQRIRIALKAVYASI